AVERRSPPLQELADPPLGGVAPPRVIDRRIHVRVKAVLVWRLTLPRVDRLFCDELDLHDRLYVFEAVFPWHGQPDRRAVLGRQYLAVEADNEQRQRMHGFVHAQTLDVGPVESTEIVAEPRHLFPID